MPPSKDEIFALLTGKIREVVPELGAHQIAMSDSMADLGVNSMERGDILLDTLEALDLQIPLVALHGPRNLGDLAQLLRDKLGG